MHRRKSQPIRNKIDLTDRTQVRLLKKRLQLSEAELAQIVDKAGDSIAAIAKQAALQRATQLPAATDVTAAVVASVRPGEANVSELPVPAKPAA